jgi:phospholipase C
VRTRARRSSDEAFGVPPITRRTFLAAAGAAGAAAAATRLPVARASSPRSLPDPKKSGIDHIVVLCMENRSFDHFLGWVPGANGRQAGLRYADDKGSVHATHRLTDWQGCGFNDPDHSYTGGRLQLNAGKCDGFRRGDNDDFALGYYTRDQLETTAALVDSFTIFDGWFCGILGPTYPNRFYTHAAATDRISNTSDTSTLPTIWDRLADGGVPASCYFSDLPVLALWGSKYASIGRPFASFFADAAAGTLPAYSYLDPFFLGEGQGGSNDDHPHADIRRGQALVSAVARAMTSSPLWEKSALLVTYDEWGGFFDHVTPPRREDSFTPTATEEHNTTGFRVPTYLVSPFAPKRHVQHGAFDHSSILKLVEWRFGLKPLNVRDQTAANPAMALDFSAPNRTAPEIPMVLDPGPHMCTSAEGMAAEDPFWHELAALPAMRSWEWAA